MVFDPDRLRLATTFVLPAVSECWPIAAGHDQQQCAALCRSWSRSVLVKMQSGGQVEGNSEHSKAPKVRGVAKISRLKLINLSGRSRYFVQFTDEVFGSQVCVTLKHLHRLMTADSRNFLIR
jgi:hypothetical protein